MQNNLDIVCLRYSGLLLIKYVIFWMSFVVYRYRDIPMLTLQSPEGARVINLVPFLMGANDGAVLCIYSHTSLLQINFIVSK